MVSDKKGGLAPVKSLKVFAIVSCIVVVALACTDGPTRRYVISESKEYEASLFRQNCAICHGPEGEGKTLSDGRRIPNLREGEFKYKTDGQIYRHIADGGNGMVPFRGQLTDREINMMVRFVQDKLRRSPTNR
jgi:cytochrome c553